MSLAQEQDPSLRRRQIAAVTGSTAALFGLIAIAWLAFGHVNADGTSLADGNAGAASFLGVLTIACLGIAVSSLLTARPGARAARSTLLVCTIVWTVVTVLGILSIGIFLLPTAILAFVALGFSNNSTR